MPETISELDLTISFFIPRIYIAKAPHIDPPNIRDTFREAGNGGWEEIQIKIHSLRSKEFGTYGKRRGGRSFLMSAAQHTISRRGNNGKFSFLSEGGPPPLPLPLMCGCEKKGELLCPVNEGCIVLFC